MKRIIGICSILFTYCLQAQVIENFADSDFTNNPAWIGTTELFVIENEQLKLSYDTEYINNTQAYLSTKSEVAIDAVWQMQIKINTSTSSANYVRFYLTSDVSDLTSSLNGYFVMIGNTNDEISLYKQTGNTRTKIIDGSDKRVDFQQFTVDLKVVYDGVGNWQLYSKINDETDFTCEGSCFDDEILGSQYSGIFIAYSKTNVGKYFFDNIFIDGEKYEDKTQPTILDYEITAADQIKIIFSEEIQTENFDIELINNSLRQFEKINSFEFEVTFSEEMEKGVLHEIKLSGICDKSSNRLADSIFSLYVPSRKDVIFNEILADPEPQVALPNAKFIELYNRSAFDIRLKNWILNVGKSKYKIPDIILSEKEFLLVCSASDTLEFREFGTCCAVSSLSSMNISSSMLSLFATTNQCVDWIEYTNEWYDSELKKDGGWSLERVDTENFSIINNWVASIDKMGGTPARKNSVAQELLDTLYPSIEYVSVDAPDTLRIRFTKEMEVNSCLDLNNYLLNNTTIKQLKIEQPDNRILTLVLEGNMLESDNDTLIITNLKDVSNLPLKTQIVPITFPQIPKYYQDIVINEILFNPKNDGVDYVELFNFSGKTLNLSEIFVTTRKDGELQKRIAITAHNEPFYPNSYLVLTSNTDKVKEQYQTPIDAFLKNINLPTLPDEEGNVVFINKEGFVFDEFAYTEKMHHVFIKNSEGVALERVNPNLPTQDAESWQSAASSVGYGTPCQINSQYMDLYNQQVSDNLFSLATLNFSPDNDGYQDLLQINYQLPENGFVVSIEIFTANGIAIKKLQNNFVVGHSGTFFWDGTNNDNSLCNVGVYVIYVEFLHPSGKRGHEKLVCSLTSM